MSISNIASSWK